MDLITEINKLLDAGFPADEISDTAWMLEKEREGLDLDDIDEEEED